VVGHASRLELSTESLDVDLLILALVPLGIGGIGELAGAEIPGVPAGDVGSDTTDLRGAAGGLVGVSKLLRAGLEVVVPAEPATVAGVDVHDDVGEVEVLESVGNAVTVAGSGVLAGLKIGVGDQVGERVGLDDESEGGVGLALEDLDDG